MGPLGGVKLVHFLRTIALTVMQVFLGISAVSGFG
jgi:hypothetical protein